MLKTPTDGAPENQPKLRNQKLIQKIKIKSINFCYQFSTLNLQKFSDLLSIKFRIWCFIVAYMPKFGQFGKYSSFKRICIKIILILAELIL